MTNKDKCLLAYTAGLIDGEGCITLIPQKTRTNKEGHPYYRPMVSIQMQDAVSIVLLSAYFPGMTFHKRRAAWNRKHPVYEGKVDNWKCYDFLKAILPFLIVKREQASILLSYMAFKRKMLAQTDNTSKIGYNKQYWIRSHKTCELLKAKKKTRFNGVKTVELLNKLDLRQYRAKREEVVELRDIVNKLLEGVETMVSQTTGNKPTSAPEQDIVLNKC